MTVSRAVFSVPLLLAAVACNPHTSTGPVTGEDYAPQYDYQEFYAVADRKPFVVIVSGNPFRGMPDEQMRRELLPVMQANRPIRLTFTYDLPPELPRPYYRLVLVFDPIPSLTAARVCANQIERRPEPSGSFAVFGVYCRNDLALSQASAATLANGPNDPRIDSLFRQLFVVLFAQRYPERERYHPFIFQR
jgi:hypothetical protein